MVVRYVIFILALCASAIISEPSLEASQRGATLTRATAAAIIQKSEWMRELLSPTSFSVLLKPREALAAKPPLIKRFVGERNGSEIGEYVLEFFMVGGYEFVLTGAIRDSFPNPTEEDLVVARVYSFPKQQRFAQDELERLTYIPNSASRNLSATVLTKLSGLNVTGIAGTGDVRSVEFEFVLERTTLYPPEQCQCIELGPPSRQELFRQRQLVGDATQEVISQQIARLTGRLGQTRVTATAQFRLYDDGWRFVNVVDVK